MKFHGTQTLPEDKTGVVETRVWVGRRSHDNLVSDVSPITVIFGKLPKDNVNPILGFMFGVPGLDTQSM